MVCKQDPLPHTTVSCESDLWLNENKSDSLQYSNIFISENFIPWSSCKLQKWNQMLRLHIVWIFSIKMCSNVSQVFRINRLCLDIITIIWKIGYSWNKIVNCSILLTARKFTFAFWECICFCVPTVYLQSFSFAFCFTLRQYLSKNIQFGSESSLRGFLQTTKKTWWWNSRTASGGIVRDFITAVRNLYLSQLRHNTWVWIKYFIYG